MITDFTIIVEAGYFAKSAALGILEIVNVIAEIRVMRETRGHAA